MHITQCRVGQGHPLSRIQACWRCMLRYSGCRVASAYTGSLEDLVEAGFPDLPSSAAALLGTRARHSRGSAAPPQSTCPLCLGSLQDPSPGSAFEEGALPSASLQAALLAGLDGYEVPAALGFSLDVSLPAAAAVRARALAVRLPAALTGPCVDLKEALRSRFTAPLEAALGTTCVPGAGLRLTLALAAPSVAEEGAWLAQGIQQQVDQSRRRRSTGKRRHGKQDIVPAGRCTSLSRVFVWGDGRGWLGMGQA